MRQHDTQVELYIDGGHEEQNLRIFEELLEKREEIEAAFGGSLDWQRLQGRQGCRISHRLALGGWKDPDQHNWPEIADATIDPWSAWRRPSRPISKLPHTRSPAERTIALYGSRVIAPRVEELCQGNAPADSLLGRPPRRRLLHQPSPPSRLTGSLDPPINSCGHM